jgi:hypothetical protein
MTLCGLVSVKTRKWSEQKGSSCIAIGREIAISKDIYIEYPGQHGVTRLPRNPQLVNRNFQRMEWEVKIES